MTHGVSCVTVEGKTRNGVSHIVLDNPGMGDSIACGVAATGDAQGWLILPADLPLVRASTLMAVAQALRQHTVVVPRYQGQQGHPVGFGVQCGPALLRLSGDQGARAVVAQQHMAYRLDVDDEGCVMDVDTVDALLAAQASMLKNAAV